MFGKRNDLLFSRKSDRKKEKSVVSFTHEQNIICSQNTSPAKNVWLVDARPRGIATFKMAQYLHRLFIPVERRLIAA